MKIEHNKPLTQRAKYPFKEMKVGDSFFIEDVSLRSSMHSAAKARGMKCATRIEDGGLRVWRVK